jgi:hypothetical protein
MPRGRLVAICLLLAGCERVVLTAVGGPDELEADAEADTPPDSDDDAADMLEASIEPPSEDAGHDAGPALNTPLDASSVDTGSSDDAGDDAASSAVDAGADAMLPACAGKRALDLCWYLGAPGASCKQACSDKGGFDTRSIAKLGSAAQGGNLRACTRVLSALGYSGNVTPGYRSDGIGLGCHIWEQRDGWWLDTMPDFNPTASVSIASIACACLR